MTPVSSTTTPKNRSAESGVRAEITQVGFGLPKPPLGVSERNPRSPSDFARRHARGTKGAIRLGRLGLIGRPRSRSPSNRDLDIRRESLARPHGRKLDTSNTRSNRNYVVAHRQFTRRARRAYGRRTLLAVPRRAGRVVESGPVLEPYSGLSAWHWRAIRV